MSVVFQCNLQLYTREQKQTFFPTTHRSLFWCVEQPPSIGRVGDVERVVLGCVAGVISSVHDEGVGLATLHHQLRNESVVDVPRNAPPS